MMQVVRLNEHKSVGEKADPMPLLSVGASVKISVPLCKCTLLQRNCPRYLVLAVAIERNYNKVVGSMILVTQNFTGRCYLCVTMQSLNFLVRRINTLVMSLFLSLFSTLSAQDNPFSLSIQRLEIPGLPGLHSFAAAEFQGKWYLFGGRRDGLHRRQPFRAFDSAHANRFIYCIDPIAKTVDSLPINNLSPSLQSQLASTNILFHQQGDALYLAGGYGLPSREDVSLFQPPSRFLDPEVHRTMPYLTRVDLPMLQTNFAHLQDKTNQIDKSSKAGRHSKTPKSTQLSPRQNPFQQWADTQFALTGGAMMYSDGVFYLVGGHRFDGLYNPMGPQNGPGFEQLYHPGVRSFQLVREQPLALNKRQARAIAKRGKTSIPARVVWRNPMLDSQFRRRDVNVMESLHHLDHSGDVTSPFPKLRKEFLLFSGVFQERANIPYTNLLEIDPQKNRISAVPNFNQLLNQYHSAHVGLYSYKVDAQFFVFFGGIAQYFFNESGDLTQDPDVPVVSTVSVIQRTAASEYSEFALPLKLPKGLGAGTEFIPASNMPRVEGTNVIDLESLQGDSQLLGYLVGGFSTTAPNVFFDNDADESKSEAHAYAVYWKRNTVFRDPSQKLSLQDALPVDQGNNGQVHFQAFTNTENQKVYFIIDMASEGPCTLSIKDETGKVLLTHVFEGGLPKGESVFALPLYDPQRSKVYQIEINANGTLLREELIINP